MTDEPRAIVSCEGIKGHDDLLGVVTLDANAVEQQTFVDTDEVKIDKTELHLVERDTKTDDQLVFFSKDGAKIYETNLRVVTLDANVNESQIIEINDSKTDETELAFVNANTVSDELRAIVSCEEIKSHKDELSVVTLDFKRNKHVVCTNEVKNENELHIIEAKTKTGVPLNMLNNDIIDLDFVKVKAMTDEPRPIFGFQEIESLEDELGVGTLDTKIDEQQTIDSVKLDEQKVKVDKAKFNDFEPELNGDEAVLTLNKPELITDKKKFIVFEPELKVDEAMVSFDEPEVMTNETEMSVLITSEELEQLTETSEYHTRSDLLYVLEAICPAFEKDIVASSGQSVLDVGLQSSLGNLKANGLVLNLIENKNDGRNGLPIIIKEFKLCTDKEFSKTESGDVIKTNDIYNGTEIDCVEPGSLTSSIVIDNVTKNGQVLEEVHVDCETDAIKLKFINEQKAKIYWTNKEILMNKSQIELGDFVIRKCSDEEKQNNSILEEPQNTKLSNYDDCMLEENKPFMNKEEVVEHETMGPKGGAEHDMESWSPMLVFKSEREVVNHKMSEVDFNFMNDNPVDRRTTSTCPDFEKQLLVDNKNRKVNLLTRVNNNNDIEGNIINRIIRNKNKSFTTELIIENATRTQWKKQQSVGIQVVGLKPSHISALKISPRTNQHRVVPRLNVAQKSLKCQECQTETIRPASDVAINTFHQSEKDSLFTQSLEIANKRKSCRRRIPTRLEEQVFLSKNLSCSSDGLNCESLCSCLKSKDFVEAPEDHVMSSSVNSEVGDTAGSSVCCPHCWYLIIAFFF